jgi:hypothetical protein
MEPTNASTPHLEPGNGGASYEAPTASLPTTALPPTSLEAAPPAPAPAAALAAPQAPPTASPAPVHTTPGSGGERCMTCGAQVAADQRYCLECGQRRGEPRLPFMDATSLMDTAARRRQPTPAAPIPPRKRGGRISANTALIAGVGTLLLALGVGVLIGRSGNQPAATTAAAPQIIKVGGGEASGTTAATGNSGADSAKKTGGGNAKAADKTGANGQSASAEEVLKPVAGTDLPPPVVKPGDKGSGAGYNKKGEFDGNFFGE